VQHQPPTSHHADVRRVGNAKEDQIQRQLVAGAHPLPQGSILFYRCVRLRGVVRRDGVPGREDGSRQVVVGGAEQAPTVHAGGEVAAEVAPPGRQEGAEVGGAERGGLAGDKGSG
jgi:hypothetical protein